MKIEINRVDEDFHMIAENEDGNKIELDGSPAIGGHNKGMRPMQLLLAGVGSCSAIDVISILKKQKQDLKSIKITVDGDRDADVVPSLFTDINIHFTLGGDLDSVKVERAIQLSMDKYCSVSKTLEPTANITHSYEIVG
ncbi:OsmC family protein [Flammeovirgaceae bacterium SG7u.111]|nr:OsmC family protein [Flammeovirgaceae bacterium SG7u.132]WPO33543.1 OsmC family protein [Flammeovirgaceae bacterium SG7u.111]